MYYYYLVVVFPVTSIITGEWVFSIGLLDYSCDSQFLILGWYPLYTRERLKACVPLRWCLCVILSPSSFLSGLFWSLSLSISLPGPVQLNDFQDPAHFLSSFSAIKVICLGFLLPRHLDSCTGHLSGILSPMQEH